jgi:hypothetical protein
VRSQFGTVLRWHFAYHPDSPPCAAGAGEPAEHLEAVYGLYEALSENLKGSWTVHKRRRLKNGRRPDVLLCVRADRRVAVAVLVQRSPLTEADWLEARRAYRDAGVRDHWLLCDRGERGGEVRRPEDDRTVLARAVLSAPDQRPVYLGWFGEEGLHARERLWSYGLPDPLRRVEGYRIPCRTEAEVPREAIWRSPRWVSYPLSGLSLSPEGYLRTGLYRILRAAITPPGRRP